MIIMLLSCSNSSEKNEDPIDDYNRRVLLQNLTENIILPRYENLKTKISTLNNIKNTFIDDRNTTNFQYLKEAWEDVYIAWQYVEMFNLETAEEIDYIKSMNTYPCNNTQIEINISSSTYDLNNDNYISWASQGLPALDYMFYGLNEDTNTIIDYYTGIDGENYCTYLNDVINQMVQNTNIVYDDWQDNYNTFINLDGNTATSSLNKLTNDFIYYYEKGLRANKIGIPCGRWNGYVIYPIGVEAYYRKNISKKLALESLNGCKEFFSGETFVDGELGTEIIGESYIDYLNTIDDDNNLGNQIIEVFTNAETQINTLNNNFVIQLTENNSLMLDAYDALQEGVVLLKTQMLAALSITVDYQDADGD